MIAYKKAYLTYYGYGEQDYVICRSCLKREAVEIHHVIFKSQGGTDDVSNLIAVCRYCHNKAHDDKEYNTRLKIITKRMHRAWANSTGG